MNTPICDFVNEYKNKNAARLHMPGHKGKALLGFEEYDITEIDGADSLYEASGIIKESEDNASSLFGCKTFYSTEGSSHCIRAMIYLSVIHAKLQGKKPLIFAGRNAHKAFLTAAALTDCDVTWLYPEKNSSYLSCAVTAEVLEKAICGSVEKPTAVYLTSPDYLGNTVDIKSISEVCRKYGALLLIDNAHGAYLKFLPQSHHPIDLGADLCCDSAHKTLPVLTGGAYLHIAPNAPETFSLQAKNALAMFGSTSPSYIIMQSLDMANRYISDGYGKKLSAFCNKMQEFKHALEIHGYALCGNEPLKITLCAKKHGYYGTEIAEILKKNNIICEFADPDFTVLMFTPESECDLEKAKNVLISIPKKDEINKDAPEFTLPEKAMSAKNAVFSPYEVVPASESCGRILGAITVGCPPAVPIIVCGEKINASAVKCFEYYGIKNCTVIKER